MGRSRGTLPSQPTPPRQLHPHFWGWGRVWPGQHPALPSATPTAPMGIRPTPPGPASGPQACLVHRALQFPRRLMPRRLLNGAGGQGLREAARPSWKLWAAQWPSDWGPGGLGVSPWGGPGEVGTSSGPRARSRARPVWAVGAGPAVRTRGSPLGDTLGPLRLRFPGRAGPCPRTHGPPPPSESGAHPGPRRSSRCTGPSSRQWAPGAA